LCTYLYATWIVYMQNILAVCSVHFHLCSAYTCIFITLVCSLDCTRTDLSAFAMNTRFLLFTSSTKIYHISSGGILPTVFHLTPFTHATAFSFSSAYSNNLWVQCCMVCAINILVLVVDSCMSAFGVTFVLHLIWIAIIWELVIHEFHEFKSYCIGSSVSIAFHIVSFTSLLGRLDDKSGWFDYQMCYIFLH